MTSQQGQLTYDFIRLKTKPTAQLAYSFTRATASETADQSLIVFVNGLGLPQLGWAPTIAKLQAISPDGLPAILTYDRFGQGQTVDRDPDDEGAVDPSHAHDCMSVVRDMHELITQITREKLEIDNPDHLKLHLVGNSIGCALIRLFAQEHPTTVASVLFLDSVITDSDFVSICPDPDGQDFDEATLPSGITPEILRIARVQIGKFFHPSVGNKEGLSRKNLTQLLPRADAPSLRGPDGSGPFITVLGHDFDTFAEHSERALGVSVEVGQAYSNPYWHRYNQGLAKLTNSERSQGPFQVPGTGHFIQADNPEYVAKKLHELLHMT
ncbi:hypothetical protein G7Z17_g2173 [Cylindrodendrum hubeiense]|uniref:AB hydrolase-1 domain-containing protein n=1 Tax=Cylindrodendrum hubeiense TaxID=595255 RepID=A0A9P5HLG0_9HYPO|nr:hypothetical protein G7Z17_g2173 [Cylindrodendrum hubeiense]